MKSEFEPDKSPTTDASVRCHVYRSSVRDGLYVYVAVPDDAAAGDTAAGDPALEELPLPVRRQLGRPELAMTLDLHGNRRLGQEDIHEVLANLAAQGFHVQMPRDIEPIVSAVADAAVSVAAERRASGEGRKGRPGKTEDSGAD